MRKHLKRLASLCFALPFAAGRAQTPNAAPPQGDVDARIRQLEAQVEAMRGELIRLKQQVRTNNSTASAAAPSTAPASTGAANSSNDPNAAASSAPNATARQTSAQQATTRQATARQAERSPAPSQTQSAARPPAIELGPVRLTPYGTIYFNAFSNSNGTNNADVPLFAAPRSAAT